MKKNSYAKINLALNVLNKSKPETLHNLDMINVSINLKDSVSITFIKNGKNEINIKCNNENIPLDSTNLISKVIAKFKKNFNLCFSCNISLNKKIPLEAGLGGGSSNAAATLDILDKNFKTNMSVLQKMKFLESITSDGPYMILSKTARVKGNGNQIIPFKSKFKCKVLLIKPKSGCSTKQIYSSLDYKNLIHPNINKIQEALENNDISLLSKHIDNSLLTAACQINNEIEDILNRLRTCGFEIVNMTGSGSTCFAISKRSFPYKKAKEIFDKNKYELYKTYKIK